MNPELEETIYCDFITSSPTTGAAADADSTPTCEVFEDATDTAILSPTVVKRTGKTGNYRVPVACTAANGFEATKSYNVVVSATVSAVVAKAVVQTFQMRTNGTDDLAASILTRATPAQVQTELGTYGALKPTTAGRTLDVTTTGEAGIDWANVGAPTTTVNLSGTTVATVTNGVALTSGERTTLAGVLWNTLTSALTTVGSIGKLLVDNVNATISSRSTYAGADTAGTTTLLSRVPTTAASQASVDTIDDFLDTEVAAIKAKTDQLTFTVANRVDATATVSLTAGDMNSIADALLKRDWNSVTGEAAYSALNAFRILRNVWNTAGSTLTVKKEDGSTTAWTRTLSTDPAAAPITGAT